MFLIEAHCSLVLYKHFSYFHNNECESSFLLTIFQRGNLADLSALAKYFGGIPFQTCCDWNNNPPRINEQLGVSSDTPNQISICSPWLQNNTIKHSPHSPWTDSHTYKHTCCDITHIWMQDWLTHPPSSFQCAPIFPFLPRQPSRFSFLSVCLSTPALRDEREEPLAHACGHHHHCDWCHSDCCLGDGSSFAEQAPPPKVQGMVEENTKML